MVWFIPLILGAASLAMNKSASDKAAKNQKKAQASSDAIEAEKLRLSREQQARADEEYARYQRVYAPLEDQLVRDAMRAPNPDAQAGLASADAELAAATQRGVLSRALSRRGIDPNSGAVADAEARLALASGKARAAAMTTARRNAVADQRAKQLQAVSLGRSLPGTSYNLSTQAGAGLSSLANLRANRAIYQDQVAGQAGEGLGLALSDIVNTAPEIIDGINAWRTTRADRALGRVKPTSPSIITGNVYDTRAVA